MTNNWTPPDGLGYSSLRAVQLTGSGIAMVVLAGAMLLGAVAAAIGLGTTASRQVKEIRLLQEQGVNTDAQITRVWRSSGKDQQHLVSYRFTVEEREYVARKGVPPRIWQDLKAGSSLPVLFLPSNPKVNHPTGWDDTPLPNWVPHPGFRGTGGDRPGPRATPSQAGAPADGRPPRPGHCNRLAEDQGRNHPAV